MILQYDINTLYDISKINYTNYPAISKIYNYF